MKKIAVVTATRAEFGLLSLVVEELRKYENEKLEIELIVTGTHLSSTYGMTVREIENLGMRIDKRIKIPVLSDSVIQIADNQAETLVNFTKHFSSEKYDAVVVLGDRYEMFMVAIAAANTHTPIFHLCGGDTTEGALDEWIRHSITKMSYLHFVTNEESRRRVIQLGEHPDRVFNFGSTSIDNILNVATLTKEEALKSIDMDACNYVLCTYHPMTMEAESVEDSMQEFFKAMEAFPFLEFIVTKSNADLGGAKINSMLDEKEKQLENLHVYTSLGVKRYLSLMCHAEFVLGNSSSGIIETPSFHIPTVNIGDRQRGRLQTESIINCEKDAESIVSAIELARTDEFKMKCQMVESPYGDGTAAKKIARKMVEVIQGDIDLKKSFYNVEVGRWK